MSDLFTFGIDLGTTNSCISFSKDGTQTVIPSKTGKRTVPSIVSFKGNEVIVGETAKNQIGTNVKNTVYGVKRLMGHKFSEKGVKDDVKLWGFSVEGDSNDNPLIVINSNGTERKFKPQEISSKVLRELGEMISTYCGKDKDVGKHAVITVPAYFNDIQRRATIEAGELAGLDVLQVINEPTAAAIAYGYKYVKEKANRTILVYDFGGGTFDVSIIEVKNNEITVKATGGDTHLGGEDIDNNLVNYYINKLNEEAGVNITKDAKKMWKLRNACEEAKIMLSEMSEVDISYDLLEDNDIDSTLTTSLFNQLNKDLFEKTITIVQKVLGESKLSKESIDDIVLVGGSSRIPEVQRLLGELFKGKPINKDINPDEAVAIGAGLLAEDLSRGIKEESQGGKKVLIDVASGTVIDNNNNNNNRGGKKVVVSGTSTSNNGFKVPIQRKGRKIVVNDILSQPIGIRLSTGEMSIIVPKGTAYNISQVRDGYHPSSDTATGVAWNVFQGEAKMAKDCTFLGKSGTDGLNPRPRKDYNFEVTMTVNNNGLIYVTAIDKNGHADDCKFEVAMV